MLRKTLWGFGLGIVAWHAMCCRKSARSPRKRFRNGRWQFLLVCKCVRPTHALILNLTLRTIRRTPTNGMDGISLGCLASKKFMAIANANAMRSVAMRLCSSCCWQWWLIRLCTAQQNMFVVRYLYVFVLVQKLWLIDRKICVRVWVCVLFFPYSHFSASHSYIALLVVRMNNSSVANASRRSRRTHVTHTHTHTNTLFDGIYGWSDRRRGLCSMMCVCVCWKCDTSHTHTYYTSHKRKTLSKHTHSKLPTAIGFCVAMMAPKNIYTKSCHLLLHCSYECVGMDCDPCVNVRICYAVWSIVRIRSSEAYCIML